MQLRLRSIRGPKFQLAVLIGIGTIALGLSACDGTGSCGSCIGISGNFVWTKGGPAEHVFTITDSEKGAIIEQLESTPPWFRVNDNCTNKGAPCTVGVKLEPYKAGLHGKFVVKVFGGASNEVSIESL